MPTAELESIARSIKYIDTRYVEAILKEITVRQSEGLDDWTVLLQRVNEHTQ